MRKKYTVLMACAVLAASLSQTVTYAEEENIEQNYYFLTELISEADNGLGDRLAAELIKEEENIVISPYSIASVLSMLSMLSEEGPQSLELREFLGGDYEAYAASGNDIRMDAEEYCYQLLTYIEDDGEDSESKTSSMQIGNAMYISDRLTLADNFSEVSRKLKEHYYAEIETRNLSDSDFMDYVNEWVDEKTNGMIDRILDEPLSDLTRLVLMNAVYFFDNWAYAFDPDNTYTETFYGANGESEVSMMYQKNEFAYAENEKYRAICLPYSQNYDMYIYLPQEEDGWRAWMDAEEITSMRKELEDNFFYTNIYFSMPKFEFEYQTSLADTLKSMGLTEVFESAVYENLSEEALALDEILHKAVLKVDEEGTEAAAVTIGIVRMTAVVEEYPLEMIVDHPFLFTITNRESGINLFEGIVLDLQQ